MAKNTIQIYWKLMACQLTQSQLLLSLNMASMAEKLAEPTLKMVLLLLKLTLVSFLCTMLKIPYGTKLKQVAAVEAVAELTIIIRCLTSRK